MQLRYIMLNDCHIGMTAHYLYTHSIVEYEGGERIFLIVGPQPPDPGSALKYYKKHTYQQQGWWRHVKHQREVNISYNITVCRTYKPLYCVCQHIQEVRRESWGTAQDEMTAETPFYSFFNRCSQREEVLS